MVGMEVTGVTTVAEALVVRPEAEAAGEGPREVVVEAAAGI